MSDFPTLAPEVQALLGTYEFTASTTHGGKMRLHDGDGYYRFTVSSAIHVDDLQAIISYGFAQREAGERQGRSELQEQLRRLFGVDE